MSSPLPAAPREETMEERVEGGDECWREKVVEKRWEEGKGGENGCEAGRRWQRKGEVE